MQNFIKIKSFRDPGGRLIILGERLLRAVNRSHAEDLRAFLASSTAQAFLAQGRLVRTNILNETEKNKILLNDADIEIIVEHQKIFFVSFPYEWPPEMLLEAGHLTLDLTEELFGDGMGLKDATPYNILFSGSKAVFVDVLSCEKRDLLDPVWLPYAQFVRTFLLPLLINKHRGLSLRQIFTTYRDGIESEMAYQLCGPIQRFLPPFLDLVAIPTWLGAFSQKDQSWAYRKKSLDDPEKTRFIIMSLFRHLRKKLRTVAPRQSKKSAWSDYMSSQSYSPKSFEIKSNFVKRAMTEFSPRKVLDIGCNTGHFSALAAESGSEVVAIDSDPTVIGEVWRMATAGNFNILPLVVDITRPSPAIGWRNLECPSFLDRAGGAFDAVLMLAIIHHMLVSERIPLPEIIDLASELTTNFLVIEFVMPNDPMFCKIARGRDNLFSFLTPEFFEGVCRRHFNIIRSQRLSDTRQVYLMQKRI